MQDDFRLTLFIGFTMMQPVNLLSSRIKVDHLESFLAHVIIVVFFHMFLHMPRHETSNGYSAGGIADKQMYKSNYLCVYISNAGK